MIDKAKEKAIPMGAEVPGFEVDTYICLGGVTIYAFRLVSSCAKKAMPTPKIVLPGQSNQPFGMPSGDPGRN